MNDEERILMLGTTENINRLQSSEHWFVDGTFKVAPELFYQVFTIHALIDSKAVPLIYCLIQDKAEATYSRVLERIKELRSDLNPSSFITFFTNAHAVGCLFHLGQCIWRKVQELGLSQLYNDNEEFRMAVKMMLALSFVPVNDVVASIDDLMDASPEEIVPLADYFEDTYIGRRRRNRRANPRFAVEMWNVHDCVNENLPGTNNSVEAWHRAFQQTVDCHHPSIFILINHFRLEHDHVKIKMERHLSGVIQPQASKNKYVQLNRRLQALLPTYDNANVIVYLRGIASNLEL
ncbi:hypothetical protein ACJMK2_026711 [Sinanodonta woodiana]|uniref:MULE transposase domain-containing protein n=1 Tax=Sinanodonta woodiana TaxID=1069815 RepID=A0ABD3XNZ4_SINWO